MFGLNVGVVENKEFLGTPQILSSGMLSATNITSTFYTIGVCTATSPAEGTAFMTIPFTVTSSKSVTLNLIINTLEKQVTVDLMTGVVVVKENELSMYPNPAKNNLYLNSTSPNVRVAIYDIKGRLVVESIIKDNKIDVSNLEGGVYLIKVYDKNKVVSGKFVKE